MKFITVLDKNGDPIEVEAKRTYTDAESSNVKEIEYDETREYLHVTFKNGKKYCYVEVAQRVYVDCLKAESIGKYINIWVKPVYEFVEVNDE